MGAKILPNDDISKFFKRKYRQMALFKFILNKISMETTVIQRAKQLIEDRGVTPRGFASEIDFNYSTLNNYLTGRRKLINFDLVESIMLSFGNISADWLITGKGQMFKDNNTINNIKYETRPRIPMTAAAACVHQKTKFFVVGTNVLDILLNKLV